MAFKLYEDVWETSTTTGTGNMTLAGAVAGWRTFASQYANNDTFWYSIYDGSNFEHGLGTFVSATPAIARTTVYRSTNGGAAVNWGAGTKQVVVTPLGVTLDSLMVPGSTGIPNRTADNTWAYKTAPSGTIVGTSDSQTLSNKTFSGATTFPGGTSIDANGNFLSTSIPCFLVYMAASVSNVTGDGTIYNPVVFDTEVFDKGSNIASGVFTAPVTGIYGFNASIEFGGLLNTHTGGGFRIACSNRHLACFLGNPYAAGTAGGFYNTNGGSVAVDMDSGDTAQCYVTVSGGTKVISVYGEATTNHFSWFSGRLMQ